MYAYAVKIAQGKFDGTIDERDGKLVFKGKVSTEAQKNEIWDAIKTIPTWRNDINADIQVTGGSSASAKHDAVPPPPSRTYTVQSGDTLSAIAREYLGNAASYMKIFEMNKDQLTDPDQIRPGQVLRLP